MLPTPKNQKINLLLVHISVLLAGCTGLFARVMHAHPAVITLGRSVFATLTLAIVATIWHISFRIKTPWQFIAITLSGMMLAAHWIAFFLAIQLSSVAIGVIGFSSFPLFITFLEPLFFKEKLHRSEIIATLVIVAGLFLVTPAFELDNTKTQGLLWGIFSGFTIALVSMLSRFAVRDNHPVTVIFHQQWTAGLAALPFALSWGQPIDGKTLGMIVVLGIIFTGLSHTLMATGLRTLTARTVGMLLCLEPVYSILLAWLLLNEIPTNRTLAGGVIIGLVVLHSSTRKCTR